MPVNVYRDFVIQITASTDGLYTAWATDPDKGRTSKVEFRLPEGFNSFKAGGISRSDRCVHVKRRKPGLDAEAVGKRLYDALFQGKLGERFQQFRRQPLRLELVLEGGRDASARLHALPWEMLFDDHHLGLDSHYSIVRSVTDTAQTGETFGAWSTSTYARRLRVLAVASDPENLETLDLEVEKVNLTEEKLQVRHLDDVSRRGLQARLQEGFHILHFMGHGGIVDDTPVLYFKDAENGFRTVSGTDLANDLRCIGHKLRPNLVVLNSCHGSAVVGHEDDLRGVALELFKAGVPAVVAMRREIPDPAAIQFSLALYRQLAQDKTVDEAVVLGRSAISQLPESEGGSSWSVPVLFSKLPNGRLFRNPFPWKPLIAALSVLTLFVAAFLINKAMADIRIAFDEVRGTESALWKDTTPLKMGLAVVKGVTPVRDQADYQVAVRLENGKTRRLVATIMDRGGRPLPEVILQADSAGTPEAIADLKEELLYQLLDRLNLLDEQARGEIKRLRPVTAQVRRTNSKGVEAMEAGDLLAAEQAFANAVDMDENYAVAHSNLAMLLFRQARYEEALPHAQKAVNQVDVFQVFHYNLACIQLALKETEAATVSLARAIDLDPGYVAARHELGKIHLAEKNWQPARAAFEQCGDFVPALKNLGRLSRALGAAEEAIVYLEQALTLPQDDSLQTAEILYLLALCYRDMNQLDLACTRVAAYFAIPHAEHLSWRKELDQLKCEQTVMLNQTQREVTVRNGPFALITDLEGPFTVSAAGRLWPASFRGALSQGWTLTTSKKVVATLLCASGNLISLEGPGTWVIDEALCTIGQKRAPGLFSLLSDQFSREQLSLGPTLSLYSRGDEKYVMLAPIGFTSSPRPELVWTDIPDMAEWRLTLREPGRRRPHPLKIKDPNRESIPKGSSTISVCRMSWPRQWPPLRPGSKYRVTIEPILNNKLGSGPVRIIADMQLVDTPDVLQKQLQKIDTPADEPDSKLLLKAAAYRGADDRGAAIMVRLDLFAVRAELGDALALGQAYLEAGLTDFAIPWFTYLLERKIDVSMLTKAEEGLGRAHLVEARYQQALLHLTRARALYFQMGNLLAVALIDEAIAEAENLLTALEFR
ncbi:MAG: CHAT domain-containing protein [Acidobacteriota bacterium]|nr:CHAT domain-containing protein [Acidobacteriota bacterium]